MVLCYIQHTLVRRKWPNVIHAKSCTDSIQNVTFVRDSNTRTARRLFVCFSRVRIYDIPRLHNASRRMGKSFRLILFPLSAYTYGARPWRFDRQHDDTRTGVPTNAHENLYPYECENYASVCCDYMSCKHIKTDISIQTSRTNVVTPTA